MKFVLSTLHEFIEIASFLTENLHEKIHLMFLIKAKKTSLRNNLYECLKNCPSIEENKNFKKEILKNEKQERHI